MTRKHFKLIAEAINRAVVKDRGAIRPDEFTADYRAGRAESVQIIAYQLATALAETNPQFCRERFLAACFA